MAVLDTDTPGMTIVRVEWPHNLFMLKVMDALEWCQCNCQYGFRFKPGRRDRDVQLCLIEFDSAQEAVEFCLIWC